jgi:hypothetical protein
VGARAVELGAADAVRLALGLGARRRLLVVQDADLGVVGLHLVAALVRAPAVGLGLLTPHGGDELHGALVLVTGA